MAVTYDDILDKVKFNTYGDLSFYNRKNDSLESFFKERNANPYSDYPTIDMIDEDFVELPESKDVSEYSLMQNFVNHLQNEHARELLNDILQGKDAAKKFQKQLHQMDLWQKYNVYRENAFTELIEDWCQKNDIQLKDIY